MNENGKSLSGFSKLSNPPPAARRRDKMLISKQEVLSVLKAVTDYAAENTCLHEETYRGGSIWEICSLCGAKWADDEGGKPKDAHIIPKPISDAYDLIDKIKSARAHTAQQPQCDRG